MSAINNKKIDEITQNVMKSSISHNTKVKYNASNVAFIVWLYDNRAQYPNILCKDFCKELEASNKKDKKVKTVTGEISKKREAIRNCVRKKLIQSVVKKATHPIHF